MSKAIGLVEYRTISSGINAADLMLKTAEVSVIEAHPVCPGKYIILITGGLSAVQSSVEAAKAKFPETFVDSFVLGNPHESIFAAIYGAGEVGEVAALGIIETFSVASTIIAADAAAKTSMVQLIELRLAKGMAGKSYAMLTGDVAAVTAAIERAREEVGPEGMYLDSAVIPRPDKKLWETIL